MAEDSIKQTHPSIAKQISELMKAGQCSMEIDADADLILHFNDSSILKINPTGWAAGVDLKKGGLN